MNKKLTGFTLAEVLITLGIIGVVAAMTIPTLMNKTNNQEYVAGFKKALSVFNSVIESLDVDNGGSIGGAYTTPDQALDAFCSKLKCTKVCHSTDDETQCFHSTDWYYLDGRAGWGDDSGPSATLADGMIFGLSWSSPNCNSPSGSLTDLCAVVTIDINGFKKPNRMGRDMFELYIEPNRVIPNGSMTYLDYSQNPSYCDPNSTTSQYNGANCGARIIQEGGMNY